MFSLFNPTDQATTIKQRIQDRYDNATKQLIAFQSICPTSIKNEYKDSITLIEEQVSSLVATCTASKKQGLSKQQLDQLSLDSLRMESDFKVKLTFLKTKVHLLEYTAKAQALIAKGDKLIARRQELANLPIHFWISDDIMRKEFSIQGHFMSLNQESKKLQTYNNDDYFLRLMGPTLVTQMDKNIKELETFCQFQEISITQMPDMNKKLLEALRSINEISKTQETPDDFLEAHKSMLASIIKSLDQTKTLDLSLLDKFIADLNNEVTADVLGVSLSLRPR